jgi:spore coat protein CotH
MDVNHVFMGPGEHTIRIVFEETEMQALRERYNEIREIDEFDEITTLNREKDGRKGDENETEIVVPPNWFTKEQADVVEIFKKYGVKMVLSVCI